MKILGWVTACVGGLITFIQAQNYIYKSSQIQTWYYYRIELESVRTFIMIVIVILIIGIAVLLAAYFKK